MRFNVFIATSMDGYIAAEDGSIEWLEKVAPIDGEDYGYANFVSKQDAILMGRNTFEKVLSFGFWPYELPVFVLTSSQELVPPALKGKATAINQPIAAAISLLEGLGYDNVYIDGGKLISSFLDLALVEELIITHMPISLGTGISLFQTEKNQSYQWRLVDIKSFSNGILQTHYKRLEPCLL